MTVITFLVFIRSGVAIKPISFIFFVASPKAVSYFHLFVVRLVFIHGTSRVRIIVNKEKHLWLIRRGGQSTNIFFIGNRNDI